MIFLFRQINHRGFSLVQVLIAFALAGGLALMLMRLGVIQTNIATRGESSLDEQEALSRMRNIFLKPRDCRATLSNIAAFRRADVDNSNNDPGIEIELRRVDINDNEFTHMSAADDFNIHGRFKINSIKLTFPNGNGNYPVGVSSETGLVEIFYEKLSTNPRQGMEKRFTIEVNMLVNTQTNFFTTITDCGIENQNIVQEDADVINNSYSGYVNGWDATFTYSCPSNKVMIGETSYHDNGKEDRRYAFRCADVRVDGQTLTRNNCYWSGVVNDWDSRLNFQCPNYGIMSGHSSIHDNGTEDRIYQFQCCDLGGPSQRVVLKDCGLYPTSGYANSWDNPVNFSCPTGKVKVGEFSYHHNHYEDRIHKFKCCAVQVEQAN